jgi:hypothetical protein
MKISRKILTLPVQGLNLAAGDFGRQLGPGPTVVFFPRHFG